MKLIRNILLLTAIIVPQLSLAQMTVTVLVAAINVPMSTESHFASGNSISVSSALVVSSSVVWDLSAKVTGNFVFGANSITPENFGLDITNPIGTQQPERLLSISDQFIVTAAPANILSPENLNLVFRTIGGSNFLSKPTGAYSTTLVYTITAN